MVLHRHVLALDVAGFEAVGLRSGKHGASKKGARTGTSAQPHHSITSSARASSIGGTSSPSALAVLRLTISSNFVGCCTGRLAGLLPPDLLKAATRPNFTESSPMAKTIGMVVVAALAGWVAVMVMAKINAADAPPSSVMNSPRWIIRSPRRRERAALAARRGRGPSRFSG